MRHPLVALVSFVLGLGVGYWRWHPAIQPSYAETRGGFVRLLAHQRGDVDTLIIGDSVTEETWLDDVCGSTFNAGVGMFRLSDAAKMAAYAVPRTHPKTVVLAIGTNDFWHKTTPLSDFERRYSELLDSLAGKHLILVGANTSAEASAFIRQEARRRGAVYIPPVPTSLTTDGVHLTAAGARLYRRQIQQHCPTDR